MLAIAEVLNCYICSPHLVVRKPVKECTSLSSGPYSTTSDSSGSNMLPHQGNANQVLRAATLIKKTYQDRLLANLTGNTR